MNGIERAYVQVEDASRPTVEARALLRVLPTRGVEVTPFTSKRMRRRQLSIKRGTLVAGHLDVVTAAFAILGVTGPALGSYPPSLAPLLGRRVWRSTLDAVLESGERVFVKPAEREKRFTGFVVGGTPGGFEAFGASRRLPVFCSEVVAFDSEHRAYVVHGEVRAVCRYAGVEADVPRGLLYDAIARLDAAGERVAGFAIDVGLTADGRWLLVECNDGFGLGRYDGVSAEDYTDLICARWRERVA
ncbi:MAG: ATP-grasp domain-containing protein [Sandaracinaceae bacterium]